MTKWKNLFEENKADKSLTSGQAYQLRLDSSETKVDPVPLSHQHAHFPKTEKKKITKDSNDKISACKFSHSFDSDTVAAAYSSQEISEKSQRKLLNKCMLQVHITVRKRCTGKSNTRTSLLLTQVITTTLLFILVNLILRCNDLY